MYINGASTLASINPNPIDGWIQMLRKVGSIGFHVNLPATGAPIGSFIFETTDDVNPFAVQGVILGAVVVPLGATYGGATYQPTDGTARNVNFDFGIGQLVPCPTARFMRMRYARTSGGVAAPSGFFVDVVQRGV
jgi:hypothetical protein